MRISDWSSDVCSSDLRNSFLTSKPAKIRAGFAAAELSYDHDWMRFRLSGLYASGDRDPYNNVEGGFDAIFENPIFGGADTSYWIRQTIPFAGGGRVIRSEEHTSELQSLMRLSYAVFCLKKTKNNHHNASQQH